MGQTAKRISEIELRKSELAVRSSIVAECRASNFEFRVSAALLPALAFLAISTGCLHRHPSSAASRRAPPPVANYPSPSTQEPETPPTPQPAPPGVRPPGPEAVPIVQGEEGLASWYGHPYHGRRTSSGEIYNMYAISAAHKTLPFGTQVRVHDLDNGSSVLVRINDRGPFVEGRIIDLSYAAAQAINMVGAGTARVRLEILGFEPGASGGGEPGIFAVQVGAFHDRTNAERLKEKIEMQYNPVVIQSFDRGDGLFHRVRVGHASSEEAARTLAENLRAANLTTVTFVVRLN